MVFRNYNFLSEEDRELILEVSSDVLKEKTKQLAKGLVSGYQFLKRKTSSILACGVILYAGITTSALITSNEQKNKYEDIAKSWIEKSQEQKRDLNKLSFENYELRKQNDDMNKAGKRIYYQLQAEQFRSEGLQEIVDLQSKEIAYIKKSRNNLKEQIQTFTEEYDLFRELYSSTYITQGTLTEEPIHFSLDDNKLPHTENSYGLMSIISFADQTNQLINQMNINLDDKWLLVETSSNGKTYSLEIKTDSLTSSSRFIYTDIQIKLEFTDNNLDGNINNVVMHYSGKGKKTNTVIVSEEELRAQKNFYKNSMERYGIELENMFFALQQ